VPGNDKGAQHRRDSVDGLHAPASPGGQLPGRYLPGRVELGHAARCARRSVRHRVHVKAQVNWTGRSSMEVGVRVMAERWNESTPATQVGSAYLVFAAVDAEGKPRPVPPVRPESERDKRRYQEAQIRRTHRLARRRAIKELRDKRAADGIDD